MSLAIITDSTCDLPKSELDTLGVIRVPLTINFQDENHLDWEQITPADIFAGVAAGADLPTTSQPSPEAFAEKYRQAAADGATEILVITISSELSGTYQSAVLAQQGSEVPVTVFDSRAASVGSSHLVKRAAELRARGLGVAAIVPELESVRDSNFVQISVGGLEYLQKGGRLGKASALIGGLLNIKPILTLTDGKITVAGKARGTRKAMAEMVENVKAHVATQNGTLYMTFLHAQDAEAAAQLKALVDAAGITYAGGDVYEIGAVVAAHVGPGTRAVYMYTLPPDAAGNQAASAEREAVTA